MPVVVDIHRVGVGAHDLGHSVREASKERGIFAEHPEHHRIIHWRPDIEAHDPSAHVREIRGEGQSNALHHPFAGSVVFGHHHEFGQIGIRQLLDDEQKKPRATATEIGRIIHHVLVLGEKRLHAFGGCFGLREGTALRQPEVDDDFRPIGQREKLFGHVGQGRDADAEQRHRADDDCLAMLHTRIHPAAQTVVERCIEQVVAERTAVRPDLEHQKAQVGREDHRADPRQQQRNTHHLENRHRVFTGCGLRETDRQKARNGD